MKVFLFHVGTPTPILETELELVRKHDLAGDTVRVVQCTGNLANSHWNISHTNAHCARCRSRFKNGWNRLNCGQNVELRTFPRKAESSFVPPPVFKSVESVKQFRYDGEEIGYGVASSLISLFRDHRFDVHKYRKSVTQTIVTSVQVYEALKHEFMDFRPDRVYVFNGRIFTHLPAILLCKTFGIEYFVYEAATQRDHYILRRNATVHDAPAAAEEFQATWAKGGPDRKEIASSWFELKRNGATKGNMKSFTQNQARGSLPVGFDREKKNVAIFNKTIDEYAAISGWENAIYSPDETEGVRRIVESFESDDRFMFYLRVHPHMIEVPASTSQLMDIQELSNRFDNLLVIWPADIVDSYELLLACEKVVTFGSTIGLEAAYWGKPSILAGRAYYESFDCLYRPKSHGEVVSLLKQDLSPLSADSALMYGFNRIAGGVSFKYFRQTGKTSGLFDSVEIKADILIRIRYKVAELFLRLIRVIRKPSLIRKRLVDK